MSADVGSAGPSPPAPCPHCGATSSRFLSARDVNRRLSDEVFRYSQCEACGLVFLENVPAELAAHYAGGGWPRVPPGLDELRAMSRRERHRIDTVLQFARAGKLLELGPWIGVFACNAKDAGFDVTAIDIDESCVRFLNATVGIRAVRSSDPASAMAALGESFDVIVMWHCLEHLLRPWDVISQAARSLRPGGVLLVSIPNVESRELSLLGARWTHVDAPRHLRIYPRAALERLCASHGLHLALATTDDGVSRQLRQSSWIAFAQGLVPIPGLRRVIGSLLGRALAWLVGLKPDAGDGAGLTAVFIKGTQE